MNPELQPQNRQKKMMISITIKAEYESGEEAEIMKRALNQITHHLLNPKFRAPRSGSPRRRIPLAPPSTPQMTLYSLRWWLRR